MPFRRSHLLLCLCILLFFGGCTTIKQESGGDALSLLDVSRYPGNVYVGVSGPYSTKKRMVEEAILSAAKSIHLNRALALDSRLVTSYHSSVGLKSFATEEGAYFDDTAMAKTIENLEVLSIQFDAHAGAVVLVAFPDQKAQPRIYQSVFDEMGKPTWLKTYPEVVGYRFGIGSAKRHYFLNDSLEAADFAAAQNLLDLKTDHALSVEKVSTHNEQMQRDLYQAQRGLLTGFTVLARYYDKETQTYWSLASCYE